MKHFRVIKQHDEHDGYTLSEDAIAKLLNTDQTGSESLYFIPYHAGCRGYTLTDHAVTQIQNHQGVLIIDYTLESLMEESEVYGHAHSRHQDLLELRAYTANYNLPPDRVFVLTGNLKLPDQPEFRVIAECLWAWTAPRTDLQLKHEIARDIARRTTRPHKFMCLMRRPSDARITFAYGAFRERFRDQGLITSWFSPKSDHAFYFPQERVEQWSHRLGQPNDLESVTEFYQSLPWMWDYAAGSENKNNPNCITNGDQYWLFRNSYLNVVHETFYYHQENQLFLSEKSFKSVNMLQPFVIFGHPGSLEWMRSQGYTTFSEWWDESYDRETDDQQRYRKVLDIVKWISEQSTDYLNDMLIDQLYVLQENHRIYSEHKSVGPNRMWLQLRETLHSLLN
jgi:hypothetical protein